MGGWRTGLAGRDRNALAGFVLTFAALYGGYGALSPFLPAFLQSRGLSPGEITQLLATAMLVRLVAGPLAGRLGDRTGATRGLLALSLALAALATLGLLPAPGFWSLIGVGVAVAIFTAPLSPLADALALAASQDGRSFEYGWVRAAGSAAFIATTVATGYLIAGFGHGAGLSACAALFAIGALVSTRVPVVAAAPATNGDGGFGELIRIARFRRVVLAAALVIGAHAMHDAFAVIVWTGAGISSGAAGWLWSESVLAEIFVFLWLGPRLLARIGPVPSIVLAALAGAVRWAVQAGTASLGGLVAIQGLHGLSFALLHLACLALIEQAVPDRLRATALSVYGSLGLGLATASVTLVSGSLYERFGASAFFAMSAMSLAAVPIALSLRERSPPVPNPPI